MPNEAILVIDVQNCFLPGGTLATGNERNTSDNAGALTRSINQFIQSKPEAKVFVTQDWHTEGHTSFARTNKGEIPITSQSTNTSLKRVNSERYKNRNFNPDGKRYWGEEASRYAQALWPDHCVQGTDNAKLADGLLDGVNEGRVVKIYKGDDPTIDSYSAIADALGFFTPHTEAGEKFKDLLMRGGYDTIYLTGIARNICVYWTLMDILNYITLPNLAKGTMKPKVVFVFDLTRPVAPTYTITKEELNTAVEGLMKNMGLDTSMKNEVFEIMDSEMYKGGGRRNKTRKAHKGNCGCSKCWPKPKKGGKRSTRKPKGHKKGCKCPICKRR